MSKIRIIIGILMIICGRILFTYGVETIPVPYTEMNTVDASEIKTGVNYYVEEMTVLMPYAREDISYNGSFNNYSLSSEFSEEKPDYIYCLMLIDDKNSNIWIADMCIMRWNNIFNELWDYCNDEAAELGSCTFTGYIRADELNQDIQLKGYRDEAIEYMEERGLPISDRLLDVKFTYVCETDAAFQKDAAKRSPALMYMGGIIIVIGLYLGLGGIVRVIGEVRDSVKRQNERGYSDRENSSDNGKWDIWESVKDIEDEIVSKKLRNMSGYVLVNPSVISEADALPEKEHCVPKTEEISEEERHLGKICGIKGIYEGVEFPVMEGEEITIGRDANIVIPDEAIGIKHCAIRYDGSKRLYRLTVLDANGVYRQNGEKFPMEIGADCVPGTVIILQGNRERYSFLLK